MPVLELVPVVAVAAALGLDGEAIEEGARGSVGGNPRLSKV